MVIHINNTLPFPICHPLWRFVVPFDQMTCPWSTVSILVWNINCSADRMSSVGKHQTLCMALIMGTKNKSFSPQAEQPALISVALGLWKP